MSAPKTEGVLYREFLNYTYPELESLLFKAEDEYEKDFYVKMCELYLARNQKRVLRDNPF